MKRKPILGETLWSLNIGNAAGKHNPSKLTEVTVTKVGRKYFETTEPGWSRSQRFHVGDWKHECGGYSARAFLYEDPKHWEEQKETSNLCDKIYRAFEYGRNTRNVSLANLKIIEGILDNSNL